MPTLDELNERLTRLELDFARLVDILRPRRLGIPDDLPTPPPSIPFPPAEPATGEEQVAAFLAEWNPDPATFATFFPGHVYGQPLPPMPLVQDVGPDPVELELRARFGYDYQGAKFDGPMTTMAEGTPAQVRAAALNDIARGLPTYWTGNGQVSQTVAAILVSANMVNSPGANSLGTGTGRSPSLYAKKSMSEFCAMLVTGQAGRG